MLDRKSLDVIGKAVVKAGTLSPRDIDAITLDPGLFDSVRARIKVVTTRPARKRLLSKTLVGSCASIAIVTAVAFGLVVLKSKPIYSVSDPTPVTPRNPVTKSFAQPDKVADTGYSRTSSAAKVERISNRPETKFARPKQSAAQQIRYDGDFYALSYAGDPNETERGGRIVRVDIPRATLFAMGVDVPLENETETVKADLLIGSDGVTRAIRVVK